MLKKLFVSLLILSSFSSYMFASTHYVNTKTLKVRTAPTSNSHHSYSIYKNHKVTVYEMKNDWARISKYKTITKDNETIKAAKWAHGDYLTPIIQKETAKKNLLSKPKTYYVHTKKLRVRLGPSTSSYHSHSISRGQHVDVFEYKNNWARISPYKIEDSEKVAEWVYRDYLMSFKPKKTLQKKMPVQKLVKEQEVKVEAESLPQRAGAILPEPKVEKVDFETESEIEIEVENIIPEKKYDKYTLLLEAIEKSDDFEKFEPVFVATSKRLYDAGTCKIRDFKRSRGWMEVANDAIYFVYCGSITRSNKIYLNVITEKATK